MIDISLVEYKNGTQALFYDKFELITDDIKKVIHRIVSEKELEELKTMPLDKLKEKVNEGLNEGCLFE